VDIQISFPCEPLFADVYIIGEATLTSLKKHIFLNF